MNVGILAVQGDFAAHAAAIVRVGADPILVRRAGDFRQLAALVLPGGESTAMLHGIARDGLDAPLRAFLVSHRPVFATCAGAILLARHVFNPAQRSYAALDIDVTRNAYGSQVDSFEAVAETDEGSPFVGLRCVFIRAPRIIRCGPGVHVHARVGGNPVLVSTGPIWAATFHPELTDDLRVLDVVLRSPPAAKYVAATTQSML